jgi:hypothetical protein
MRYVAYEPRTATFETLALRTWLEEANQDRKIRKTLRKATTQVWFPERKIDIKIYAARRGRIAPEAPVPRRCLSLGRFALLSATAHFGRFGW